MASWPTSPRPTWPTCARRSPRNWLGSRNTPTSSTRSSNTQTCHSSYSPCLVDPTELSKATGFQTAAETDGKGASGYDAAARGFVYNSRRYSWRDPGYGQDDRHPVVNVTWQDAQAFCAWLSRKEQRRYRLPREAEWEYACRAGTTARFLTGEAPESLKSLANLADQSLAKRWDTSTVSKYGLNPKGITFQPWDDGHAFTAPVGSFQPNGLGLYDMLGNVGELCSDWYQSDYYRESPALDPKGPLKQRAGHVVRGGTFLN